MRRLLFLLLLSAGFLLSFVSTAQALRVAIVGDSHAQALGPRLAREYASRGYTVSAVVAEPGWSSHSYHEQGTLRSRVGHIDVAVVILGGNHRRVHDDEYLEDVSWILDQLRAAGASTILWFGPLWASSPRYQERHRTTKDSQSTLIGGEVRWFDLYHSTRGYVLRRDGVHFSRGAYDRMVSNLFVPLLFP